MKIVIFYYYLYVLLGMLGFLGFPDYYTYITIALLIGVFISVGRQKKDICVMDVIIVLYMFYQLFSCFIGDEKNYYNWWLTIKVQVFSMAFYFVGRYKQKEGELFLNNMTIPMLFAMIVGLVLFFAAPSWYIERRTANLTETSSIHSFYETTRLSSFWPWSYTMGYASLFYFMYYYKKICEKKSFSNVFIIFVTILTLFFAQQRVTIAFVPVFLFLVLFFDPYGNRKMTLKILFVIGCAFLGIVAYLLNFADSDLLEYISNRLIDSEDNIIYDRFGMFSHLMVGSILGTGVGSCGHAAYYNIGRGATDCEYIRLFVELGFIGSLIIAFIYVKTLVIAIRNAKFCFFDFSVVLFYIAAMIGATPFENFSMQPFLFWFCVGRIITCGDRRNAYLQCNTLR